MSKRKRSKQTQQQTLKKQKIDNIPDPDISFLGPFIEKNKFKINNITIKKENIKNNQTYKMFFHSKWDNSLSSAEKDLVKFIPEQIVDLENAWQAKSNGTFDYLNLTKAPYFTQSLERMDFYDMEGGSNGDEQIIRISPFDDQKTGPVTNNPHITLIHEGAHALDDLYMRIYQNEAINQLAKLESNNKDDIVETPNWYTQAQNILNVPDFKKYYPYNEKNGKVNIENTFNNLAQDYSSDENNVENKIKSFTEAQEALNWLRINKSDEAIEGKHFFASLGEFTGFAVQNIDNIWNISNNKNDDNYWEKQNDGRKFLKAVTKGVQNNFLELEPNFAANYPDVHKAFNDRIFQLKREEKTDEKSPLENFAQNISNPEDYFAYRQRRRQKKLPSSEEIHISSNNGGSTPSPSQRNADETINSIHSSAEHNVL